MSFFKQQLPTIISSPHRHPWSSPLAMASGERHAAPAPPLTQPRSWAQIASSFRQSTDNSPIHNVHILNRIKNSTTNFIQLDNEAIYRASRRFQFALYGKLFGKSPPFEHVKSELISKWSNYGEIHISDLPNGFMLVHCSSQQSVQNLLSDGPWSVNGIILQLSPWKPFFEPSFAKLNTAAIWV